MLYVSGRTRTAESKSSVITGVYTNRIFNKLFFSGKTVHMFWKEPLFLVIGTSI